MFSVLVTPRGSSGERHFLDEEYVTLVAGDTLPIQVSCYRWATTREPRDQYLVEGEATEVLSYLRDNKAYIEAVEQYRHRDPIMLGDPTFAKAAQHLEKSR